MEKVEQTEVIYHKNKWNLYKQDYSIRPVASYIITSKTVATLKLNSVSKIHMA